MKTREKPEKEIVPAPARAIAVRSAALVVRGLRDLARDSNWIMKKVFTGYAPQLAIAATGEVCAISPQPSRGPQNVVLYDAELTTPTFTLTVPKEAAGQSQDSRAAFAWSPTARYLVAAWTAWRRELHFFDLHEKMLLGTFGKFKEFPEFLAWSRTGKYLSAAMPGSKRASLRLWKSGRGMFPVSASPIKELSAPDWIESQTFGEGFGEEGAFSGYGRIAFNPSEDALACVCKIQGEWADDSIAVFDVPALGRQVSVQAQGHITDLSWTSDGEQIVYCAAGQAYRLGANTVNFEPLPFGAELCACHPHLPVCVCFSSWLRNSAKGRLFIADLSRLTVFDECPAEGVADLQWSRDGSKAYAVTQDGLAYIYDPPLM